MAGLHLLANSSASRTKVLPALGSHPRPRPGLADLLVADLHLREPRLRQPGPAELVVQTQRVSIASAPLQPDALMP